MYQKFMEKLAPKQKRLLMAALAGAASSAQSPYFLMGLLLTGIVVRAAMILFSTFSRIEIRES